MVTITVEESWFGLHSEHKYKTQKVFVQSSTVTKQQSCLGH